MGANYTILADVELDPKSIQSQLDKMGGKLRLGTKGAIAGMNALGKAASKNILSYQVAHAIFTKSVRAISAMTDEVFELDKAQIEFQKISDLSGQALDDYVGKLSETGKTVGRTGKPKCQAPNVGMINQH